MGLLDYLGTSGQQLARAPGEFMDNWQNWRQSNRTGLLDATQAGADATMKALRQEPLSGTEREALVNTPAAWLGTSPVGRTGGLLGQRGDVVDVGWHLRDVDRGALQGLGRAQNRALSQAVDNGAWTVETLPVRSIYGTQRTVNADFAGAASRYGADDPAKLPLVVKSGGKYYAQDGHHRLMGAAQDGQTAQVRLVNLDGSTADPDQLRLLAQSPYPTGLLAPDEDRKRKR